MGLFTYAAAHAIAAVNVRRCTSICRATQQHSLSDAAAFVWKEK